MIGTHLESADFNVTWAAVTHPGQIRSVNEDAYLADRPIFVVADGMGGHARGEVASTAVVSSFTRLVGRPWADTGDVVNAVEEATRDIRALSDGKPGAPGSTLTGVTLTDQPGLPCWLFFNVGDSRAYLLSGGVLTQVSVDHSASVVRAGAGFRTVVTRALGAGMLRPAAADQWVIPAATGDRVLLCSDGLTNEVTEQLITAVLLSEPDLGTAAQTLVEAAVEAGGRDNVTVVVVEAVHVCAPSSERTASDDPDPAVKADDATVPDDIEVMS